MRTIEAVESKFSTIFCAVPAFRRVEPAIASGPVSGAMAIGRVAPEANADST